MNLKKNFLLFIAAFLLLISHSFAVGDDGSARRYADVADDKLISTFSLLERKEVQDELKLSSEQIERIKHICHSSNEDVAGLKELIANHEKRQSDPAISDADKEKMKESVHDEIKSCIDAYQRKELSTTLSANQKQRLDELLIQMRGPIALTDDPAVALRVRPSETQTDHLKQTAKYYEAGLKLLKGRYGRLQISGRHKGETQEDRHQELEALFVVIRAVEREREVDLLLALTPDQLVLWAALKGKPLPIDWPPTSIYESPFEEHN